MKLAVIGAGTAGSQSIIHLARHFRDHEIEWYYDSTKETQAVGEGATLTLPRNMSQNLSFNFFEDLPLIDGTIKTGIYKENWGGQDFFHEFPPPMVSMHFNAKKMQSYIYEKIKNKVKIIDQNVQSDDLDCDYVIDCSGTPDTFNNCYQPNYIPVNSVHVTQCWWDKPRFFYTLTIARPYGWVFGIPLQNRCSIGYLYNNKINSVEDVKQDVQEVFNQYRLQESNNTNTFSFSSYYKKRNFTDRVAFNGNSSFFLEPLEATSTAVMDSIQRKSFDIISGNITVDDANFMYLQQLTQIEKVIALHYFSGSKFDTKFWEYATNLAEECIDNLSNDPAFLQIFFEVLSKKNISECYDSNIEEFGSWWLGSFLQNINGLGIKNRLKEKIFK